MKGIRNKCIDGFRLLYSSNAGQHDASSVWYLCAQFLGTRSSQVRPGQVKVKSRSFYVAASSAGAQGLIVPIS